MKWLLCFLTIMLLLPSTAGCGSSVDNGGRLIVAVTLLPQAGFVEAIGGDKVEVVVMVPPGASPHTYEVTAEQMIRLSQARMYTKVGSPVEFELAWMDKMIAANRNMLVIDCARGITLMEMGEDHDCDHDHDHDSEHEDDHDHDHDHTGIDPHIWLSVRNAIIMAQNICEGLIQVDPENREYYKQNCAAYIGRLQALDEEIRQILTGVENRRFMVFHPAFGYFARDYGLEQIAVEQDGKEPDAAYLVRLISEAREHSIKVIFAAPQYSLKSAGVIASEIRGEVVLIDPLAKDFVTNMSSIAGAMERALR